MLQLLNMSFKPSTVVGLLACILAAVCVVPAQSNNTYRTVGEALQAKNLTVLLAAVQVSSTVWHVMESTWMIMCAVALPCACILL